MQARRLRKLTDKITEESIRCRAKRFHDWAPETAAKLIGGFESWETCNRGCGARRYSILSNSGHIIKRAVKYPTGYLVPPGEKLEKEDVDALRLMVFHWDFDEVMGKTNSGAVLQGDNLVQTEQNLTIA